MPRVLIAAAFAILASASLVQDVGNAKLTSRSALAGRLNFEDQQIQQIPGDEVPTQQTVKMYKGE
jgi:hypothetical protein